MSLANRFEVDGVDVRDMYESAKELSVWGAHGIPKGFFDKVKLDVSYKGGGQVAGRFFHRRNEIILYPKASGSVQQRNLITLSATLTETVLVHEMVHAALDQPGSYNGNLNLHKHFIFLKGRRRSESMHGVPFKKMLMDATGEYFEIPRNVLGGMEYALTLRAPYAMDEELRRYIFAKGGAQYAPARYA